MQRDFPDRPIVAVGVVVWRGDRVLLIRRGKPPSAGQWSLPGGAQELGEPVAETARREVREETGLELAGLEHLTVVDLIEPAPEPGHYRYHYTLVDFVAEAAPGNATAAGDAVAVGWFDPADLANLGLWAETLRIIDLAANHRRQRQEATDDAASAEPRNEPAQGDETTGPG